MADRNTRCFDVATAERRESESDYVGRDTLGFRSEERSGTEVDVSKLV